MQCYLCGNDIGDKIGLCGDCRESADERRQQRHSQELEEREARYRSGGGIRIDSRVLAVLVGLVALCWWAYGPKNYGEIPEALALEQISGGEAPVCMRGETCVVAYLTPWCPACKKAAGQLPEVQRFIDESGAGRFVAVIGGDSPERLAGFGAKCRVPTLLDTRSEFVRAAGSGGVPRFYKIGPDGVVRRAFSGMVGGGTVEMRRDWFARKLDMEL